MRDTDGLIIKTSINPPRVGFVDIRTSDGWYREIDLG